MTAGALAVQEVDRAAVGRWLPLLDQWLLPEAFYGVQHTWPALYRGDGQGRFFVIADGDRLLSHCACRVVTVHGAGGTFRACLIGSVVTDPAHRGQGLASAVLAAALRANSGQADVALLWAERAQLYARAGFGPGPGERCLLLARRPRREVPGVRLGTVADHGALHALHGSKPLRVARSAREMAMLLSTPGMQTVVLERDGAAVAYACCGKGADLQGHWHELGGSDDDLARLLPAAMHLIDRVDAAVLLPPFRGRLAALLADHTVGAIDLPGPMVRAARPVPPFWIDGLDAV